jgi:hypothetical protein
MSIDVLRRTFAAAKHQPGSEERVRLNRDTLTSEYYTSHRYMTRQPFTMDDGTPHPTQHCVCRTFTTKAEADAYALKERTREATPPAKAVKVEQVDLFATQGGLFAHVAQPGELE